MFMFSRFCHFYHISPQNVLDMSVKMFFGMERQIPRIRAEEDLRYLAVATSTMSGEAVQRVHKALVIEQGEVFQISRSAIVRGEDGAIDKLKSLMS